MGGRTAGAAPGWREISAVVNAPRAHTRKKGYARAPDELPAPGARWTLAFARSCMLACAIRGQLGSMSEWDLPSAGAITLWPLSLAKLAETGEKLWLEAGLPRLTRVVIPIKLEESNRGCPDPRESAAVRFLFLPRWEVVQLVGLQTLDMN